MKYWIEEVNYDCRHGNRYFVFTKDFSYTYDEDITISVPYHAEATAYRVPGYPGTYRYIDMIDYLGAWEEWLTFSRETRREYIRTFRSNKKLNTASFADAILAKYNAQVEQMRFVTHNTMPATVTPAQENTSMNTEFYTERQRLHRAARDPFYVKDRDIDREFHVIAEQPKTVRDAIAWIKADHFEKLDDKDLDRKLEDYEDALDYIHLRKHAADDAGAKAAKEKLTKEFQDIDLKIDILDPKEALAKVEHFRDVACKTHTVH